MSVSEIELRRPIPFPLSGRQAAKRHIIPLIVANFAASHSLFASIAVCRYAMSLHSPHSAHSTLRREHNREQVRAAPP